MVSNAVFMWSDRSYRTLLSLYPAEFRIRFGKEMAQVFRDCCRDDAEAGGLAGLATLWLAAFRDLGMSIPRERTRVMVAEYGVAGCAAGLIDSVVILSTIGFHLFAAGAGVASYIGRNFAASAEFVLLSATAGAALGGFGVICSLLTRRRRVHYRFIELR